MNLRDAIGVALIVGFLSALGLLFIKAIPQSNEQLIVYMLGQLSGFAGGIVAYHYTTKAGEKELETKQTENTGKALDAIKATALATKANGAERAAEEVAEAAVDRAEEIKGEN